MGTAYYESFKKAPPGSSIIPNAPALEQQSSLDIESLLNPPALFPDTSRRAAEVSAGRGVAGSAAAWGTGLRMTDEERIRRMALGEQLMSGAYARNLPLTITPWQQAQIDQANQDRALRERLALMARSGQGGRGGGGGYSYAGGSPNLSGIPRATLTNPSFWTDLSGGGGGSVPLGGMTPVPAAPTDQYLNGQPLLPGVGALSGAGFGSEMGAAPGGSAPSFGDTYTQLFGEGGNFDLNPYGELFPTETPATSTYFSNDSPPAPAMTEEQSYYYYGGV